MNEYAVLVSLISTESGDAFLMEVRSDNIRQGGEICFPGGKIESGETPADAAVREACEELGISPGEVELMPGINETTTVSGRKVYVLAARLDIEGINHLQLSEGEVAEVFLLPCEWIKDNPPVCFDLDSAEADTLPEILRGYLSSYNSYKSKGKSYYWEYGGHGIWGLTASILKEYVDSK